MKTTEMTINVAIFQLLFIKDKNILNRKTFIYDFPDVGSSDFCRCANSELDNQNSIYTSMTYNNYCCCRL
jgi:hypothetical protein